MTKSKNIYLIKDVARLSGHSIHTVNYYLNLGLLKEFGRSPETNYRFFDDKALRRLNEIRELRSQGHSIKSIQKRLKP
ncbi:MAG: MerR family transcriptional regulator [Elusimicrobiota bacterium]